MLLMESHPLALDSTSVKGSKMLREVVIYIDIKSLFPVWWLRFWFVFSLNMKHGNKYLFSLEIVFTLKVPEVSCQLLLRYSSWGLVCRAASKGTVLHLKGLQYQQPLGYKFNTATEKGEIRSALYCLGITFTRWANNRATSAYRELWIWGPRMSWQTLIN